MLNFIAKIIGNLPHEEKLKEFSSLPAKKKKTHLLKKRSNLLKKHKIPIQNQKIFCGLVGIKKMGKSCHINSVLQCLINTIPLTKELLTKKNWMKNINPYSKGSQGDVICLYYNLLREIWSGENCVICPNEFYKKILELREISVSKKKLDLRLFLESFLAVLKEDLNEVILKKKMDFEAKNENLDFIVKKNWDFFSEVNKSLVKDLFYSQIVIEKKCEGCEMKIEIVKQVNLVELEIPCFERVKFEGYVFDLFGNDKILKFSFFADLREDLFVSISYVLENLGKNWRNFEGFFFLRNLIKKKICCLKDRNLRSVVESKKIFFLVETRNFFLDKFFCLDEDFIYLSLFLEFNFKVKNVEQILKFKKEFLGRELYLLVFFIYFEQFEKYVKAEFKYIFENLENEDKKKLKENLEEKKEKNTDKNLINEKIDKNLENKNNEDSDNSKDPQLSKKEKIFEKLFSLKKKKFKDEEHLPNLPFEIKISINSNSFQKKDSKKTEKILEELNSAENSSEKINSSKILDFTEKIISLKNLKIKIKINPEFFHFKNLKKSLFALIPEKPQIQKPITLQTLLKKNRTKTEKCQKCQNPLISKSYFSNLPKIIIFYLNRYKLNKKNHCFFQKNEKLVNFPLKNLDLNEFYKNPDFEFLPDYRLYAVCNKFGGNKGHINAYCLNNLKNKWFSFDSEVILEVRKEEVVRKEAVLLFYCRK